MTNHVAALVAFVLVATASVTTPAQVRESDDLLVVVRVVDSQWLPIPGAQVILREQDANGRAIRGTTSDEGLVQLRWQEPDARDLFDLQASMPGFRRAQIGDIQFGGCGAARTGCRAPRYVQLQLEVSPAPAFVPVR